MSCHYPLELSWVMTTFESPSRMMEDRPISWAKAKGQIVAIVSTSAIEMGRGTFFDKEAMTRPRLFRITIPIHASLESLKTAPSKFTLKTGGGGGDQLTWVAVVGGFVNMCFSLYYVWDIYYYHILKWIKKNPLWCFSVLWPKHESVNEGKWVKNTIAITTNVAAIFGAILSVNWSYG